MEFLAAENENRQLKDLPQAVFGRVLERFLFFFTSFFAGGHLLQRALITKSTKCTLNFHMREVK